MQRLGLSLSNHLHWQKLASRLHREDPRELRELFIDALTDLGVRIPNQREAAETAKLYFARSVAEGSADPEWGAQQIIYSVYMNHVDRTPLGGVWGEDCGISDLIAAYCQIDDHLPGSAAANKLREEVVASCERIVREGGHSSASVDPAPD